MKILYFSPIEYQGLKQRPQYIAEGLARQHEVTYVDPTVSMMKFLLKGGEKPGFFRPSLSGGIGRMGRLFRAAAAEKIFAGSRSGLDWILPLVFAVEGIPGDYRL